ncbi:MAG TPA: M28 family metallopeptidase [Thermoleophilaceae bacterium]|nr:M28 family metallopeptidase [Thermoleophilaceae bacterium]
MTHSASTPQRQGNLTPAEQDLLGAVSDSRIERWLRWFEGHGIRLAGTAGEAEGARYVATELEALGVSCELHEFESFVSHGEVPERFGPARVVLPTQETIEGKIFAFCASTPPGGVEAPVVWVGDGSAAAYAERNPDIRGKIVLCDLTFEAPHSEPVRLAEQRGAAGVVVANWGDGTHTSVAKSFWGNPEPSNLEQMPGIPVVGVSGPAGRRLREVATDEATVRIDVQVDNHWTTAVQPVATIPGKSERFVLVYCHLDTLGPGMTDNTTGVVGLLELAHLLHERRDQLAYTVKLAWWSCHEMFYNGSTAFLDERWDELYDRCLLVMNLDSWAIGDAEDQIALWAYGELEDAAREACEDAAGVSVQTSDFSWHEAEQTFWPLGVPSAMVFSYNRAYEEVVGLPFTGPWWHTEQDTLDKVGRAALLQLCRVQALLTFRLAGPALPPFSYSRLTERVEALCTEIARGAPEELGLDAMVSAARRLREMTNRAEAAIASGDVHGDPIWVLMSIARTLNSVLYTVVGHYGQDPCAASHLVKRFPALQLALDELAETSEGDEVLAKARLIKARRERNRVVDALLLSYDLLRDMVEPLRPEELTASGAGPRD